VQVGSFTLMVIGSVAACSMPTSKPVPTPAVAATAKVEGASGDEGAAGRTAKPAATRVGKCGQRGDTASFTLLHVNDLQARYSERIDGKSRYARLAGAIRAIREETPASLVLDAGDDYEKGSLLDLRTEGAATRAIVHALPFDVRTLGNHDFAYGERSVRDDVRASPHPVVLANVRDPQDPALFRPYVALDVGCARVGVFGLVTRPYGSDDEQEDADYGVLDHDPRFIEIAERIVGRYRGEVDVMVALTHLGKVPDTYLAREVPGIDLVVGGHSENTLPKPLRVLRTDGTTAYVLQTGRYGENLGRADIAIDLRSRKVDIERYTLLPIDASSPVDESMHQLVARLESDSLPGLHDPIATVTRERSPRDLVDLLAHVARRELDADALVVGKDAFWGKLSAGPITLQRLYDLVLAQKQPIGTPGFTSLWTVDVPAQELDRMRSRLRRNSPYVFAYTPGGATGRGKKVRLALEKRILEHPNLAFYAGERLPPQWLPGRYGAELIDLLEKHARAQSSKGAPFDAPL
jgi:2',3'-cyclic-nucleotide 2'-phosphodiesterase (5'-nucleotidase family)